MHTIIAAALAGLMATPHCAGMCGGFAAACTRTPPAARRGAMRLRVLPAPGLWSWHSGRLTTYAVLGAVAGGFGRLLPGPAWLPGLLAAVLLVWFAAALAGLRPQPTTRVPGLTRAGARLAGRQSPAGRFAFGMATGLLPCGMVYAALSLAIAAAHPLHGALALLAFGAATVPGLTLLSAGVQRFTARGLWARRTVAAVVLVLGLWSVAARSFAGAQHGTDGRHGASVPAAARDH